jgi:hypothetical protein
MTGQQKKEKPENKQQHTECDGSSPRENPGKTCCGIISEPSPKVGNP